MSAEIFETKPRWPGAPPICIKYNLPAFESVEAFGKWESKNCPGGKTVLKWKCSACGMLHVWGVGYGDPAGGSSGTGRGSKLTQSEDYLNRLHRRLHLRQKPKSE